MGEIVQWAGCLPCILYPQYKQKIIELLDCVNWTCFFYSFTEISISLMSALVMKYFCLTFLLLLLSNHLSLPTWNIVKFLPIQGLYMFRNSIILKSQHNNLNNTYQMTNIIFLVLLRNHHEHFTTLMEKLHLIKCMQFCSRENIRLH